MNKKETKKENELSEKVAEDAIRSAMEDVTDELVNITHQFNELGDNLVELADGLIKATETCHKTITDTQKGFEKMMEAKAKKLVELQKIMEAVKK